MKFKLKLPKPRNPVALAANQRLAGAHDKPGKVKRRDARQALAKAIRQGQDFFLPLFFCTQPA